MTTTTTNFSSLFLTDDEFVAIGDDDGAAGRRAYLPSLAGVNDDEFRRAGLRGRRSLQIRGSESDPDRWAAFTALARLAVETAPRLIIAETTIDGRAVPGTPVTCGYQLADRLGVEAITPDGVHAFSIADSETVIPILLEAVTILWGASGADGAVARQWRVRGEEREFQIGGGVVRVRPTKSVLWGNGSPDELSQWVHTVMTAT